MKNIILVIIFFIMSAQTIMAEDCNCTIFPFKPDPPCFTICAARLINKAAVEELEFIVGLDKDVAQRIVSFAKKSPVKKGPPVKSLDMYKQVLSEKEYQTIENKIRSLSQSQAKYLMQPASERQKVVKSLEDLKRM
jgi:hypothetical protein